MVTEIQEFALSSLGLHVMWSTWMFDHENYYISLTSQKEDKVLWRIFTHDDMQLFVLSCNFIIACCILSDSPCQTLFLFLTSVYIQYNIIFIYWNWVSTWWQWSLHLHTKVKNSNMHKEKQCISQSTQNRKQIVSIWHIRFMREH